MANGKQFNEGETVNRKLSEFVDYDGPDASIEISLYEYGLIWKMKDEGTKEYEIIYGTYTNANCVYRKFACTTMSEKEFIDITEYSWFDKSGWDSYRDSTEISFPNDLQSAIMYHGTENIFGGTSLTFKIEEDL